MTRFVALTLLGSLLLPAAVADNLNPPPWDPNADYWTYARWEFSDQSNPAPPDEYVNPFGEPWAEIMPGPGMGWLDEYDGRFGVWELSGEIWALIWNEQADLTKEVWIQITWAPQPDGVDPLQVEGIPAYDGIPGNPVPGQFERDIDLPGTWTHSTYTLEFPQPDEEWIHIWGDINVDELVVHTRCIPEPATLCLLGLASLALIKRR